MYLFFPLLCIWAGHGIILFLSLYLNRHLTDALLYTMSKVQKPKVISKALGLQFGKEVFEISLATLE